MRDICSQFKHVRNIYDIMALCFCALQDRLESDSLSELLKNEFLQIISDYIYKYIDAYDLWGPEESLKILLEDIRSIMLLNFERVDYIYFGIIYEIDQTVSYNMLIRKCGDKDFIEYNSLNSNFIDKVRIIPFLENTMLKKSELQFKENSSDGFSLLRDRKVCRISDWTDILNNYIVYFTPEIDKFDITIYSLSKQSLLGKRFSDSSTFSVAIIPFVYDNLYEILDARQSISETNITYINFEKMNDNYKEKLNNRYLSIMESLKSQDVDFVIFPEMLLDRKFIINLKEQSKSDDPSKIVLNGTIWENYSNHCDVTDSCGSDICKYYKKIPYKKEISGVNYIENLKYKDRKYCLIDIEGYGRIGIAICRDLYDSQELLFPKMTSTDIFLVPSYTESMDLFSSAQNLASEYNIVSILCNSCSALWKKDKMLKEEDNIGFYTIPCKKNGDRDAIVQYYKIDENCKDCTDFCKGKILKIDFSQTIEDEVTITYKHNMHN